MLSALASSALFIVCGLAIYGTWWKFQKRPIDFWGNPLTNRRKDVSK